MTLPEIAHARLMNQHIALSRVIEPEQLVAAFGAMQAQDYSGCLWAIALRLPSATAADIERAVADRKIVRSWPMRGTLHFMAAADVHWMLKLLTPRVVAGATRRRQQLGLDDAVFLRCRKVFERALQGNKQLTREAMLALLESDGISTAEQRSYHILWRLAQEGVICFAGRSGKQPLFALLDEWVTQPRDLDHDSALQELAYRYFTSHGPASLQDFVWWSGLKVSEARKAIQSATSQLLSVRIEAKDYWTSSDSTPRNELTPAAYLLPAFDEHLLGYRDRSAVLHARHAPKIVPGSNGMFLPTIVINGRVIGTWKRVVKTKSVTIDASPFAPVKKAEKDLLAASADRYGHFLGLPADLRFTAV